MFVVLFLFGGRLLIAARALGGSSVVELLNERRRIALEVGDAVFTAKKDHLVRLAGFLVDVLYRLAHYAELLVTYDAGFERIVFGNGCILGGSFFFLASNRERQKQQGGRES